MRRADGWVSAQGKLHLTTECPGLDGARRADPALENLTAVSRVNLANISQLRDGTTVIAGEWAPCRVCALTPVLAAVIERHMQKPRYTTVTFTLRRPGSMPSAHSAADSEKRAAIRQARKAGLDQVMHTGLFQVIETAPTALYGTVAAACATQLASIVNLYTVPDLSGTPTLDTVATFWKLLNATHAPPAKAWTIAHGIWS